MNHISDKETPLKNKVRIIGIIITIISLIVVIIIYAISNSSWGYENHPERAQYFKKIGTRIVPSLIRTVKHLL